MGLWYSAVGWEVRLSKPDNIKVILKLKRTNEKTKKNKKVIKWDNEKLV